MLKKKLTVFMLAGVMMIPFGNTSQVFAEEVQQSNEFMEDVEKLGTDVENAILPKLGEAQEEEMIEGVSIPENGENDISSFSEAGHNTADTALYLDGDYIGNVLTDTADTYDNWYYFHADANKKIAATLEQPAAGDYDLYLYEYHDDGTLTLVSYSINAGSGIDNLSYISDGGYYFLRTVPVTADNSSLYFIVNILDKYDKSEPDDNVIFSKEYSGYMNVSNTIDNVFDQDWMKFNSSKAGTYKIELNNVPSGAEYIVCFYDSSMNYMGGVSSTGNASSYVDFGIGAYYMYVASNNNVFSANQSYNLRLSPIHSISSEFHYTHGGHIVEITPKNMYIDGTLADLNWEFKYDINYVRYQHATITDNTKIMSNSYQNGNFIDAQNINRSTDCVRVKINNFNYFYFYYDSEEETFTRNYGENEYMYVYVDADTGKAVGSDSDIYLTWSGFGYTFNQY